MTELTGARWRKSTRSGGNGGDCVEVADNLPNLVAVRDSKDPTGPLLAFAVHSWSNFIDALQADCSLDERQLSDGM